MQGAIRKRWRKNGALIDRPAKFDSYGTRAKSGSAVSWLSDNMPIIKIRFALHSYRRVMGDPRAVKPPDLF